VNRSLFRRDAIAPPREATKMTYRDDDDAQRRHERRLAGELVALDARLAELPALRRDHARLRAALRRTRAARAVRGVAARALALLRRLR
jgi:hypothetical protein